MGVQIVEDGFGIWACLSNLHRFIADIPPFIDRSIYQCDQCTGFSDFSGRLLPCCIALSSTTLAIIISSQTRSKTVFLLTIIQLKHLHNVQACLLSISINWYRDFGHFDAVLIWYSHWWYPVRINVFTLIWYPRCCGVAFSAV